MDAKMVREWRANYEALNRLQMQEDRDRTPAQRYGQLLGIWQMALHLKPQSRVDLDMDLVEKWDRLRDSMKHG